MQCFFLDAQGERRCLATGMKYEDVNVEEEGAKLGRIRTLMKPALPKLPAMHSRGANQAGEARTNVAHVQVSAAQAQYKAAGNALETPMGGSDPMMVEEILTSGGHTSVGEAETYPVRIRSKTVRKESEMNKAELRALQHQQDELRNQIRAVFEKQQEEIKAQAGEVRSGETKEQVGSGKKEVQTKAKEDPMMVSASKLLYPRTPRSASSTKKENRRIVPSERRDTWRSQQSYGACAAPRGCE